MSTSSSSSSSISISIGTGSLLARFHLFHKHCKASETRFIFFFLNNVYSYLLSHLWPMSGYKHWRIHELFLMRVHSKGQFYDCTAWRRFQISNFPGGFLQFQAIHHIMVSRVLALSDDSTTGIKWHSYVSQASNLRFNEKWPRTVLSHFNGIKSILTSLVHPTVFRWSNY